MAMVAGSEGQFASHADADSAVARIDIYHDIALAEAIWRGCENSCHLFTPYQRFDFLKAWLTNIGPHQNVTALIVVAFDKANRPLLVLPLGQSREKGSCLARFLGGKHTTFNMGLWRRDFATSASKADIDTILAQVAAEGIDVLALMQQPKLWAGIDNPMQLYAHQPSVNMCPTLYIPSGAKPDDLVGSGFRRRIRGKERKLKVVPGYHFSTAETDADISRVLDAFFRIKPLRMAAQNLPNVFADPGIEQFLREACHARLMDGSRAITIHALECDEEVIAMFAGVAGTHRFSTMFNTYTMSENAKHSPGLILIRDMIDFYARENFTMFDLGIGSDDYKRQFCKDNEPIFDSFIPLSARGSLIAPGMSLVNRAKRLVKQNPALMQMASRLRNVWSH